MNSADTICVYAQINGEKYSNPFRRVLDTICVYAQIDGNIKTGITHSCASDTICTYTQVDWLWATLALICASTRSVYVQVDKNNK